MAGKYVCAFVTVAPRIGAVMSRDSRLSRPYRGFYGKDVIAIMLWSCALATHHLSAQISQHKLEASITMNGRE